MQHTSRLSLGMSCLFLVVNSSACKFADKQLGLSEEMNVRQTSRFGIPDYNYDDVSSRAARSGFLSRPPWKDDYWPLMYKNVARRYFDYLVTGVAPGTLVSGSDEFLEFATEQEQANDRQADPKRTYRYSPAEKYDFLFNTGYPLTHESWKTYEFYNAKYQSKNEWSWMGICHGWALASYSELPPSRHVLARKNGKSMLFFEGDIRALLSKVYAHNDSVQTHYMGSRCEVDAEDLRTDEVGRIADFSFNDGAYGFFAEASLNKRWRKAGSKYQYTRITMKTEGQDVKSVYLVVDDDFLEQKKAGKGYLFSTPSAISVAMQRNNVALAGLEVDVTYLTPCRDVNPAQFHAALVQHYSDRKDSLKKGFVFEVERSEQVWNHPVWGFHSIVSAIEPIGTYGEYAKRFASPKATHVAEVRTKVIYLSEEGPLVTYEDKDPKEYNESVDGIRTSQYDDQAVEERFVGEWGYSTQELKYTLEFQKLNGEYRLIGGEWGNTGLSGRTMKAPDFIWKVEGKPTNLARKKPSPIRYSDVAKLLACSNDSLKSTKSMSVLQKEAEFQDLQYLVVLNQKDMEYVECNLD